MLLNTALDPLTALLLTMTLCCTACLGNGEQTTLNNCCEIALALGQLTLFTSI